LIASPQTAAPRSWRGSRQNATRAPIPDRSWPLRPRLFFYVTIALLPIAIVSILQGLERSRIDNENVHERLILAAKDAAIGENNVLAQAERTLRTVATFAEVRAMTRGCDYWLGVALATAPAFSNLARLDANGNVVCSALPAGRGRSASDSILFRGVRSAKGLVVSGETWSPILRRPVIAAMLPLRDAKGGFAGAVASVLDVHWLDQLLHSRDLPKDALLALFDRRHSVVVSTDGPVARPVFAHASLNPKDQDKLQSGVDSKGDAWTYATSPLIGNSVFVGFAMRENKLFGATRVQVTTDFLMPIFMIAVAWVAIWFATDRVVTQWIYYLRRVAAAYRSGHYAVRPALHGAPSEFRLLGEALADMAAAIQDRDRRLRDALEQKSTLIREVHHRVKNNLQIVMSLLSLQAGQLRDPAAREALMQAQVRINALALVHRILHEIEDQSTVDLKRLIEELALQVTGGLGGEASRLSVATDIVPRDVTGDMAVPLALFTVEALTNIFKHAYPAGEATGRIEVSLRDIGAGRLRLAVEDNGVGFDSESTGRSIGSRLIHTFGQQVGGTSAIRSNAGQGTIVELVFPDPARKGVQLEKASAA
jgi:two-component sensor histidine kinase